MGRGAKGHGTRGLRPVGSVTSECRCPAFAMVSLPRALRRPSSEARDCGRSRNSCAVTAPPRATYINLKHFFQEVLAPSLESRYPGDVACRLFFVYEHAETYSHSGPRPSLCKRGRSALHRDSGRSGPRICDNRPLPQKIFLKVPISRPKRESRVRNPRAKQTRAIAGLQSPAQNPCPGRARRP